ncbi:MAG: GlxA family transcriptional regulator [Rhodoferax sp.]|nr:GlxA family transcriptional regulator [Rhodoferax sp.]MCW5629860.1 GlxA family transcriptional regulator [Rhodoferax sp.]MCW5644373.1 GlxA family transcriptional regulator [Rhodoferax sp.]
MSDTSKPPVPQLPRHRFVFLTLPNYTMLALASAIDALRMANRVSKRDLYEWTLATLDGEPVPASNGLSMSPTVALDQAGPANIVFVVGGVQVEKATTAPLLAALRRLAQRHVSLGSLCTGGYALAKAGLLDKYRAVIHWENMTALREEFPRVIFSDQLFAIDRDRYTCTGGIAPLDLMLHIIKQHQGRDIGPLISEQFILDRIRNDQDRQHIPLQARVGLFHENLIEAAALMEANIEEPLSLDEIAALVGVSRRQIERLFKRYVGQVPTKYYLDMRLRRARDLLLQTPMSIMQVAVACGFQSPPHFSKCYRMLYGYTPSAERSASRSQALAGLAQHASVQTD